MLLHAVLQKMEIQVDEFGLDEDGADLVLHKRLVCCFPTRVAFFASCAHHAIHAQHDQAYVK
eukprot:2119440-Pleurochrysis_carterae.AAC.1